MFCKMFLVPLNIVMDLNSVKFDTPINRWVNGKVDGSYMVTFYHFS